MIPAKRKVSYDLFEGLMKKGRVHHSEHFSFRLFTEASAVPARFSVVVAKKIDPKAKSAVWRNTVKRRFYTLLRPLLLRSRPGTIGVFFVKKTAEAATRAQLSAEIEEVLNKAGAMVNVKNSLSNQNKLS
ncbi:MAG: ribonuclease P protein component [Patescibacteria group bacterium]